MCLGWGWYLQNDMQIFIVSMLYIFVYAKNKLAGYSLLTLTAVLSLALNIYEAQAHEYVHVTHIVDFTKWSRYFPDIYIKPWTRCPPYIVGLIFGLLHMEYLEADAKLKLSEAQNKSLLS